MIFFNKVHFILSVLEPSLVKNKSVAPYELLINKITFSRLVKFLCFFFFAIMLLYNIHSIMYNV